MIKTSLMYKKENELGIKDIQTDIKRLYEKEHMSTRQIAKHYGIGLTTSRRWIEQAGVNFRSISESAVITFSKMSTKERIEHTRKATEESRELRNKGLLVIDTSHLTGENAVSRRPEVRKKNSEAQKKRTNRAIHTEESFAKMRKSMERHLRTNASIQELTLLRALNERGYFPKFQHAACRAVMDFAFVDLKIGIEVDGVYHVTRPERQEKDLIRDEELEREGWILLRFFNEEIVYQLDECINEIIELVDANHEILGESKVIV